ncbi:MAG: sulfatase [Holophagales bacterium]|nr:MAG: sulfatase [Holophagales bacterium]
MRCLGRPSLVVATLLLLLDSTACRRSSAAAQHPPTVQTAAARSSASTPTGFIVISLDTLRADRLGAYGYDRPTTPFLDRLAARATLFERAIVQYPGTLQSHMSMFTGLYPREHAVFPPALRLSADIPTLPELFHAAGYRTAGHSEGGFVKGYYGFSRGFDEWDDPDHVAATDLERTLAAGRDFLRRLEPGERFFLFLHTYALHDPYTPPVRYRRMFWQGPPPPGAFPPTGPELARVNERGPVPSEPVVAWLSALYDASLRYTDDQLAAFVGDLERSGLLATTTLVVTSDHGEEFLEHGHLSHVETYEETLHVPLLVLRPGQKTGQRVESLVESIDLAPTLLELAGLPAPPMSGRSYAAALQNPATPLRSEAFAEGESWYGGIGRALYRTAGRELLQLVHTRPLAEPDGSWVSRELRFDTEASRLDLEAVSFAEARQVELSIDGVARPPLTLDTEWRSLTLDLGPPAVRRISLRAAACQSPQELGQGSDPRCLSFKLRGTEGDRVELFDLTADRRGILDLSRLRADDTRTMLATLHKVVHTLRSPAQNGTLEKEHERALRTLGYLR